MRPESDRCFCGRLCGIVSLLRRVQDPEKYQFVGCINPDRVDEVKGAVGQYRNEHKSLAHFAAGHDYPFPHGQQWLYQHN